MTTKSKKSSVDLTVVAVPFYFLTMWWEYRTLARLPKGSTAGQYESRDTRSSLLMGQLSLITPLIAPRLLRWANPSRSKSAKWVAVMSVLLGLSASLLRPRRSADAAVEITPQATKQQAVSNRLALGSIIAAWLVLVTWWNSVFTARNLHRFRIKRRFRHYSVELIVALVGWDFTYYWNHRLMHTVRALWAMHVVHHSSERYNLSTALRQPVAEPLAAVIPYGLVSVIGVRPSTLNTARGINLLWQFWIHTETVRSLGSSEAVLNSPSAHRVHHGSNGRYLDKNHGGIFIVWDRLFGSYEKEDEAVIYGLTKNINSFSPWVIVSHEYQALGHDVLAANDWSTRASHLFRPPGWKPVPASLGAPLPVLR